MQGDMSGIYIAFAETAVQKNKRLLRRYSL
jgi:hypothetical protein